MKKRINNILVIFISLILGSVAFALPTTTTVSAPATPPQPLSPQASGQETADIGLAIVEDHLYQESLANGNQIGDSIFAAGRDYFRVVRDALESAHYKDDRIDPYAVRTDFNYRKYWHSLHALDQRTLDTLAGAWAVDDPLEVSWAYGFRVVRYSQASLFLDEQGQVLAVMVRVRHPGELQRYPIFLSLPYLKWFLETRPADPEIIADLVFLTLVEASTVEPYTLREAVPVETTRYAGRDARLVVEEADYYPAMFYVDYVETRYVAYPVFYDVDYVYHHPWWPYHHRAYAHYHSRHGVWPRYHPNYGRPYARERPIPWLVSGKGPVYDKHYRRLERGDSLSPGRSRETVRVADAYRQPRPSLISPPDRSRGGAVPVIGDKRTGSIGAPSLTPGRGIGTPSIGEGRGIGAPSVGEGRGIGAPSIEPPARGGERRDSTIAPPQRTDSGAIIWRGARSRSEAPAVDPIETGRGREAARPAVGADATPDKRREFPTVDRIPSTRDARSVPAVERDRGNRNISVIGPDRERREAPAIDTSPRSRSIGQESPATGGERTRVVYPLPGSRAGRSVEVDRVPERSATESAAERGRSRSVDIVSPPARGGDATPVGRSVIVPQVDRLPERTRVAEPPASSRGVGEPAPRDAGRVITPQLDRGRGRVIEVPTKRNVDPPPAQRSRSIETPSRRSDAGDSTAPSRVALPRAGNLRQPSVVEPPAYTGRPILAPERSVVPPSGTIMGRPTLTERAQPTTRQVAPANRGR